MESRSAAGVDVDAMEAKCPDYNNNARAHPYRRRHLSLKTFSYIGLGANLNTIATFR